jgi:adenylate cyclase
VRISLADLNRRRDADGLLPADIHVALHLNAVFHGNISNKERLDFTVIGPAVNEASRIAALSRSVDQSAFSSRRRSPRRRFTHPA